MSAYEDWVKREVSRRSALLTIDIPDVGGHDDNPNLPGAPSIIQSAPLGTFFHEDTADVYWRRYKSEWKITGAGSNGGGDLATNGDMTIPVDYSDPTAADPPAGTVFTDQDVVDDTLTTLGISNFKHLEPVYKALPIAVRHEVTISVSAGEHRAFDNGDAQVGYDLTGREMVGEGVVRIVGPSSSTWPAEDPGLENLAVTAFQVASDNPWLQFAGTPFNGFDLRGDFVVLSTGQVNVIHDHTDDTLYLLAKIDPDPTGATLTVANPNAQFVNFLDDGLTPAGTFMFQYDSKNLAPSFSGGGGVISLTDILADNTGGSSNTHYGINSVEFVRVRTLADASGNAYAIQPLSAVWLSYVSVTGAAYSSPFYLTGRGQASSFVIANYVYAKGATGGPAYFANTWLVNACWVLDNLGGSSRGAVYCADCYMDWFHRAAFLDGKANEIRNISGPDSALVITRGSVFRDGYQEMRFKDCAVPCVLVRDAAADLSSSTKGLKDEGGNTDVGIELEGPRALVKLNADTDITGTLGDVRMSDGDIWDYADIVADGPIEDLSANMIEKV